MQFDLFCIHSGHVTPIKRRYVCICSVCIVQIFMQFFIAEDVRLSDSRNSYRAQPLTSGWPSGAAPKQLPSYNSTE